MSILCFVAGMILAGGASAQGMTMDEKKIQAGLVYNFLKYTTWPSTASANKTIKICLLGGDPFSGNLFPLEGRTAQQRSIEIEPIDNVREGKNCNIVYIHQNLASDLASILASLAHKNILTMSDIPYFSDLGGMIEFATAKDSRIHLYINRQAVDSADLRISERLLNLAELERAL